MAIRAEWRSLLGRVSRRNASQQAVAWTPHSDGSAMAWLRSRNPHVTFVVGALIGSLLIGASVWLMGGYTLNLPSFGEAQVASTAPRYAPLNLTEQSSSPVAKSEPEPAVTQAEQTARVVADEEVIEVGIGHRVRLGARIDDADALEPETVALVSGLPDDVQLSDGIKINTQLWMLRPVLLSSVEVDAARGPVGRYPVKFELRTPEGHVISSAQTTLAIVAAVEEKPEAAQSAPSAAEERKEPQASVSAEEKQPAASTGSAPAPPSPRLCDRPVHAPPRPGRSRRARKLRRERLSHARSRSSRPSLCRNRGLCARTHPHRCRLSLRKARNRSHSRSWSGPATIRARLHSNSAIFPGRNSEPDTAIAAISRSG
ncbi:MAG: hypothetical protein HC868_10700 [Sphingomonadales bacterium]|nr:hypothetical protein [Sphingomonadales bacterium]